ncbi:E3 ubiquitin-protein ligase RNF220-like [Tachypleus tridentatus]|uniref:E3 ubiquitin-protein ligase RNF220-like n=1 Tax=Tachypleus tridentatus TaxID=6853 RepID=UPI003FD2E5E2
MDDHGESVNQLVTGSYSLGRKIGQLDKQFSSGNFHVADRTSPYLVSPLLRTAGTMEQQTLSNVFSSTFGRPPCFPFALFYNQPHAYSFLASHASSATLSAGLPHYDLSRQMALLNSTTGGAFYPVNSVKTNLTSSSTNLEIKDGSMNGSTTKETKIFHWPRCHPTNSTAMPQWPRCHLRPTNSTITPQKGLDLRSPEAVGRVHSNKSLSPGSDLELSSVKVKDDNEFAPTTRRSFTDGQPYCPICGINLQSYDLTEHVQQEMKRLHEFYRDKEWNSTKDETERTVVRDSSILSHCGKSPPVDRRPPLARWETYLRVRSNRHVRINARHLTSRRRTSDRFQEDLSEHKETSSREPRKGQIESESTASTSETNIETEAHTIEGPMTEESRLSDITEGNRSIPESVSNIPDTRLMQVDENADPNKLIDLLQDRLKELQTRQQKSPTLKCQLCQGLYEKPVVSVCCWHVLCERCWLQALGVKRVCPQCETITFPSDLRMLNV